MTSGRHLRAALVAAVALAGATVSAAAEDPARETSAESAQVREARDALERAFLAAEADHAKVRARGLGERLGSFPRALAAALAACGVGELAAGAAAGDGAVDAVLARLPADGRPLSAGSLRVVLGVMLTPAERARTFDEATVRDELVAAARSVFDSPRFEDVWDAKFLGLPEVLAWRAATAAARAAEPPTPPPPDPETPPDPAPGPEPPVAPPVPPTQDPPTAPGLPPPDVPDPLVNLVPLDRTRAWVGPWRGWIDEIPDRDNHRQKRTARPVWIDRYEVTCAQYLRFLLTIEASRRRDLLPAGWALDEKLTPSHPEGRSRTPVTGITYFQAQEYAQSLGKRLPTEDEWDRAAGGGEKEGRAFPWGSAPGERRWALSGAADGPVAVDAFPDDRTPDGIVGLAGNVAELVATLGDRRDAPAKLAPTTSVVIRGGSWRTTREADCGTDFRWVIDAGQSAPHVGFRCVTDEAEFRRRSR